MLSIKSHLSLMQNSGCTGSLTKFFARTVIVAELVKKFLGFYGTRMFISTLIQTLHWTLSLASSFKSHHIYLRSILIFLSVPGSLKCYLPFRFSDIVSPYSATCPVYLKLDLITSIIFGEKNKLWRSPVSGEWRKSLLKA